MRFCVSSLFMCEAMTQCKPIRQAFCNFECRANAIQMWTGESKSDMAGQGLGDQSASDQLALRSSLTRDYFFMSHLPAAGLRASQAPPRWSGEAPQKPQTNPWREGLRLLHFQIAGDRRDTLLES